MKQKLAVPVIFRRRNSSKNKAAAKAGANVDGAGGSGDSGNSAAAGDFPSMGRVNIVMPKLVSPRATSPRIIDVASDDRGAAEATASTPINTRKQVANKQASARLPQARAQPPSPAKAVAVDISGDDQISLGSFETAYSGQSLDEVGVSHLSMRDRMWYKNQLYLLKKQQQQQEQDQEPLNVSMVSSYNSSSGQNQNQNGAFDSPARQNHGLSSRYRSSNNNDRTDCYAAGINKHTETANAGCRDSPKGVDELPLVFESTNMYKNVRNVDSKKEVRFLANNNNNKKNRSGTLTTNEEDDAGTKSSSLLYSDNDDDDTRTKASSLFYSDDDDTRMTNPSSALYHDDACTSTASSSLLLDRDRRNRRSRSGVVDDRGDDDDNASESNFDEVTLGSLMEGETLADTVGDTITEGESCLYSLDDGTTILDDGTTASMSYVFELLDGDDDEKKQRRNYQIGVGQGGMTTKLRKGRAKTTPSSTPVSGGTSPSGRRRRVRVMAPRNRTGKSLADDSAFTTAANDEDEEEVTCPIIPPEVIDEITGTYKDVKSALSQVMYAFFVSPDDIDRVSDKWRDAKSELVEMFQEQKEEMYLHRHQQGDR